jgi:hypothetical protein
LWPFDIFFGYLVYFTRFGTLYHEKSGNPALSLSVRISSQECQKTFFCKLWKMSFPSRRRPRRQMKPSNESIFILK